MFKEIFLLIFVVFLFFVVGILVSLTNIDYTVYDYYEKVTKKTGNVGSTTLNKKLVKDDNFKKGILVEVFMEDGSKFVYVDEGTTKLEVFAILGGKLKNILTISNLFKIITTEDNKVYLTR